MVKKEVISLLLEKSYSVSPCHPTDLLWEMMQVKACLRLLGKAELCSEEGSHGVVSRHEIPNSPL